MTDTICNIVKDLGDLFVSLFETYFYYLGREIASPRLQRDQLHAYQSGTVLLVATNPCYNKMFCLFVCLNHNNVHVQHLQAI